MFSVHTSSEKLKTQVSQFDLCLKTTWAVQSHDKRNILLCLSPQVCFPYQRGSPLHNQGHLPEFRRPNVEIRLEEKRSSLYKMKTSIFLFKKEICYPR